MPLSWTLRERMPRNGARDGPYRYDAARAEAAVLWFPKFLRLPDGPHAGEPFLLPPWQANIVRALDGWRRPNGLRRYTRALVGVGRGNAKSSLVAGLSVKGLVGMGVRVPKVITAGTDRENAGIIFGYAAGMVRQDRRLRKRLRVLDATKRIIRKPADGGLLRVISSDASHAHGIHPTLLTIDDLQAQESREFLGVLQTSQGTVSEPLMVMCMTAGYDSTSIGWEEWEHGQKVLADPGLDEELLVDLHYLTSDDDWQNPELWVKANPNLGISVSEDYLRQQVRRAIERPSIRNDVLMLHFNIWPRGELVSWIPPEEWEAAAGVVDEASLQDRPCFVGVVATSSADIAAVVYLFPADDERPGAVVLDAFVPADNVARLEEQHKVSYRSWIEEGWLTLTEGNVIDERAIVQSIERRQETGFGVQEIACNPRGATALMRSLDEAGFTVTSVLPSFAAMSPAMNELEKLVRARRIAHAGDRLLAHMMRNLQARRNADGDLKPDAERSGGNIAGPTALLMALSRVLAGEPEVGVWAAS